MANKLSFFSGSFPKINTGTEAITIATMVSIWSISTITSLPGLAVSPILGDLKTIFPSASDLEIQMLTSLPNMLIIPFVLLGGKISEKRGDVTILAIGLSLFLLCGILYFFANDMRTLIVISCFLGVGAGMIVPLSTGLIANFFTGGYRTQQMGLSSGINNLTLVLATLLTGWLAHFNWHLPFIVYLIPIIALSLLYFLTPGYLTKTQTIQSDMSLEAELRKKSDKADGIGIKDTIPLPATSYIDAGKKVNKKLLWGLVGLYFLITYITIVVTLNISFVLAKYEIDSSEAGTMISIYFLSVTLPGFYLIKIVRGLKDRIVYTCFFSIAVGFLLMLFFKEYLLIVLGVFLAGLGYGILQPLIYDKTSLISRSGKTTTALAIVMTANYLAILVCPFISGIFQSIFDESKNPIFPFWLNLGLAVIAGCFAWWKNKSFLFSAESSMYHDNPARI